jgi:hypothetical protein
MTSHLAKVWLLVRKIFEISRIAYHKLPGDGRWAMGGNGEAPDRSDEKGVSRVGKDLCA